VPPVLVNHPSAIDTQTHQHFTSIDRKWIPPWLASPLTLREFEKIDNNL